MCSFYVTIIKMPVGVCSTKRSAGIIVGAFASSVILIFKEDIDT
jgi:hypothetical protein